MVNYVHLRISTEYSVTCSNIRIGSLLQQCAAIGLPAASITDQASMFGTIRFFESAQKSGIKGIIGCAMTLQEDEADAPTDILLLCKNTVGYKNLIKIVSAAYSTTNAVNGCVSRATVLAHSDGLIALSGAMRGDVGQCLLANNPQGARQLASEWQSAFGDNYFLELQRVGHSDEEKYIAGAVELALELNLPVVATNAVMFLHEADYEAHEIRCAIASKSIYNSTFDSGYTSEQYLKTPQAMCELFADLPSALTNSVNIAVQCTLDIELGNHQLPQFPYPEGHTLDSYFEERARQGLDARLCQLFPQGCAEETRKIYSDRLEYELSVITGMQFSGYFLIVADFIVWSKDNGIPVGPGRGSGTGSLVAYSLLISEMDPIEYELLFERFLNPERVALPDFDIDFCIDGRERTIEYVREKYGKDSVSQIATFGTMAAKAVVKDVTRALDRPYGLGEKLARAIGNDLGVKLGDCMAEGQELLELYHQDEDVKIIVDYALQLEGLVRSIGKHAGGVVISPTLTTDFTPIYRESQTASAITQYDKKDVELAGLVKFDFLGLKNLTIINNTFSNMRLLHQGENHSSLVQHENDIPLDDEKTYEMLRQGKTASVFQLESAGMTDLVVRLSPRKFDDLIPLVALYRPGPLQAGIVDDFIDRRGGKQKVSFPHTDLEPTLAATYGVIIFQEQIMHIGRTIAGYTMGMADELRSAVAKKKPVEMAKHKTGFAERADERGYDKTMVQDLFKTIEVFASYCFPKAHSATYAWLAYQTAYLKANHPSSYMAAVLTADMGLTDKAHIAFTESTNMGVSTLPAHINHSEWIYLPTSDTAIRMGLGAIKGVQQQFCLDIIKERDANGNYASLADLTQRLPTSVQKATLENLVRVGAADGFGESREEMLDQLTYLLGEAKRHAQESDAGQFSLLDEPAVNSSNDTQPY